MAQSDDRSRRSSVEERYEVLLEMGRVLTSTLGADQLYAAIHRETSKALPADDFTIALYDQGRDLARVVFHVEQRERREVDVVYRGSDSELIRSQRSTLVEDDPHGVARLANVERRTGTWRSGVAASMVHRGRVFGTIGAWCRTPGAYTTDDRELLAGIADIAAIAINNALQFAELERRRREAEQVEEIGRALTSELDPQEVLGKVAEAALGVLDLDGAAVWMRDGREGTRGRITDSAGDIAIPVGTPWELHPDLAQRLIRDGQLAVVDDIGASRLIPDHLREWLQGGSGAGVPITVADEIVGVLAAGSRQPRRFGPEDTAVLQRLARQASVALENARLHANLRALSLTDPLTGLPNRRRLQLHLEQEVAAARRGRLLSVVMLDIDNFKAVNDGFGHVIGDDVLRRVTRVLIEEQRAMNLVGRFGGDEFASVLSDSDLDGARHYVDRVRARIGVDPVLADHGVTVSMGVAQFDARTMKNADDLVRAADADMYASKAHRRRAAPSA